VPSVVKGFAGAETYSESGPKKFQERLTDRRSYNRDCKTGSGEYVGQRPEQASLPSHAGVFKFSHQEVGIEQKNNESDLNQHPPSDLFCVHVHGRARIITGSFYGIVVFMTALTFLPTPPILRYPFRNKIR
jgi:hypothetical protein